jgi:hypothetical protein
LILPRNREAAPIATVCAAALFCASLAGPAPASPDGAQWETATRPEGCLACHLGAPVTEQSDGLVIEGLPKQPIAGEAYPLSIALTDPDLMNAGFLLRVDAEAGSPGTFESVDGRTETMGALARSTYAGSTPAEPGNARWALVWIAPGAIEGPLRFSLWANAGNWDLSPLGDRLHHRDWRLGPRP